LSEPLDLVEDHILHACFQHGVPLLYTSAYLDGILLSRRQGIGNEWARHTSIEEDNMADFFDLLKERRSIRDFEDREVPLELIKKVIRDSCLAPSSANGQPWRFIIVNNRGWIKRLSDESKKNLLLHLEKNPDGHMKQYERALRNKDFNVFYNAPCLVYILAPRNIGSIYVDCALAACYFMFSAAARGLGTCWVGLGGNIRDPAIANEMGLPQDCRIIAPIIVGYPKSIPDPPQRNAPQILKIVS
jgi:nitroreductase